MSDYKPDMADIDEDALIAYLENAIPPGVTVERIERETDLIASGIIDSFGIVGVVDFIEERFGVTVDDADIDPENFRTVIAIVAYVAATRKGAR
jgi:acyl carrier protein